MIKTIAIIASTALYGINGTLPDFNSPITCADIHVSNLTIQSTEQGLKAQITETADFSLNLTLRSGHIVKVSF